jgi:hypothetical protein
MAYPELGYLAYLKLTPLLYSFEHLPSVNLACA